MGLTEPLQGAPRPPKRLRRMAVPRVRTERSAFRGRKSRVQEGRVPSPKCVPIAATPVGMPPPAWRDDSDAEDIPFGGAASAGPMVRLGGVLRQKKAV